MTNQDEFLTLLDEVREKQDGESFDELTLEIALYMSGEAKQKARADEAETARAELTTELRNLLDQYDSNRYVNGEFVVAELRLLVHQAEGCPIYRDDCDVCAATLAATTGDVPTSPPDSAPGRASCGGGTE